jgi:chromosome segregation ATPase
MCDPLQEILAKLDKIEEEIHSLDVHLNKRMDLLQESFNDSNKRLDLLQESFNDSNKRLENIEVSTDVMDEHVQWVNDVHNVVKKPLFTALNAVNYIVNPLSGPTVDVEEVPNAPTYQHSLTHVKEEEDL